MAAPQQRYSMTRTRATWKPRVTPTDLPFLEAAGGVCLGVDAGVPATMEGTGRTLVAHPPYEQLADDATARRVPLLACDDLPEGVSLDYRIDGGFNDNCVKVSWKATAEHPLRWVCLKTFTGMQLKYALPGKRSPLLFALADEDAFAYCDKAPCEECAFRCKSGFTIYACFEGVGVARLPMDRISSIELQH